jgi:hypothetical protein
MGDIGIGLTRVEQSNSITVTGFKTLDLPNAGNTAALTPNGNLRYTEITERVNMRYNLPFVDKWYDGFGVSYALETSNRSKMKKDGNIVVKPDSETNIITVGIYKMLEEVKPGFSFMRLSYGMADSTHTYYDYDTSSQQSFTTSGEIIDVEMIYLFKPKKNRFVYLSGGILFKDDDGSGSDEIKLELGMMF